MGQYSNDPLDIPRYTSRKIDIGRLFDKTRSAPALI
jgi:hypothetical protein